MDPLILEIIGILCLITLIGLFSAVEVAVVSARKSRMLELAEAGNRKAVAVINFKKTPDQFLATVHAGVIFSLVLASGLAGLVGSQHLTPAFHASRFEWLRSAADWLSLIVMVCATGFFVVVFGELVPKSLSLRYAESIALLLAQPMVVASTLLKYPAGFLTFASNLVLSPFKDSTRFTESRMSEEEFKLMLEEGARSGVIDKTEHDLIASVFEFSDTIAKEVMIPRPDIVAININTPRESVVRIVLEEGYSRMPVFRDTIDNIVGIVYTKDLLGLLEYRDVIIMQDIIRPAYFVPETKKISQLMRELQARKIHMAVVIDEFGGTEGIITMEDILEEIVGEIHDEYDEEIKDVEQAADGSFLVNARMPVSDFGERFRIVLPESDEYDTLSGFLYKQAGRIPDLNEIITFGSLCFTVVKKSQRRIRLVRVRDIGSPVNAASPSATRQPDSR